MKYLPKLQQLRFDVEQRQEIKKYRRYFTIIQIQFDGYIMIIFNNTFWLRIDLRQQMNIKYSSMTMNMVKQTNRSTNISKYLIMIENNNAKLWLERLMLKKIKQIEQLKNLFSVKPAKHIIQTKLNNINFSNTIINGASVADNVLKDLWSKQICSVIHQVLPIQQQ
ncbi:Hypothetical_protein [Hexamita inflata]|uniref:Hypothetical_protein n=1 Tax=Hexamita inflata TaxID=28002 RepID=A0AA86UU10_9EUKA|nr:Hypothetical protein HINF_LOCUS52231 [Hexamita inflata]